MKDSHNHSEEILRDRLTNYNFPKQPGSWEKMEMMLPRSNRWPIFPILGVTSILITIGLVVGTYTFDNSVPIVDQQNIASNSIVVDHNVLESDYSESNLVVQNTNKDLSSQSSTDYETNSEPFADQLTNQNTNIDFDVQTEPLTRILNDQNNTKNDELNSVVQHSSNRTQRNKSNLNTNSGVNRASNTNSGTIDRNSTNAISVEEKEKRQRIAFENHLSTQTGINQATPNGSNIDYNPSNTTNSTNINDGNIAQKTSIDIEPKSNNTQISDEETKLPLSQIDKNNIILSTEAIETISRETPPIDIELINQKSLSKQIKISLQPEILTGIQLGNINQNQIYNVAAGLHSAFAFSAKYSFSIGVMYRMQWLGSTSSNSNNDLNDRSFNDGTNIHYSIPINRLGHIDVPLQFHVRVANPISLTVGARMSFLTEMHTQSILYSPTIAESGIQPFDLAAQVGIGWHIRPNVSLHLMYSQSVFDITHQAAEQYDVQKSDIPDFDLIDANISQNGYFPHFVGYEKLSMFYLDIPDILTNSFVSISLRYKF